MYAVKPDQRLSFGLRSVNAGMDFNRLISGIPGSLVQRRLYSVARKNVEAVRLPGPREDRVAPAET